jgi:enoyl-CoA hydratase
MAVRTEDHGPVRVVVLDRPERRNAVDRPHAEALAAAFRELDADPGVAVGVLWGAGGTFCAGADLKAVAEGRPNRLEPDGDGPMGPSRMELDTPVIAAIEGHAVAGGLELACWADLRVVAEDAVLGVFCRRWGVPLIDGGTARLPALIGLSHALDLILTGRPVDAAEARQLGLANRVVPPGDTKRAAIALATELAAFPQGCLRADRRAAIQGVGLPLKAALAAEFAGGLACLASEGTPGAARFAAGAGRHGAFDD